MYTCMRENAMHYGLWVIASLFGIRAHHGPLVEWLGAHALAHENGIALSKPLNRTRAGL